MEHKCYDVLVKRKPSGAAVMRPELTTSLFRALFDEWAKTGYAAISLERVAAHAGAGRAAIYRRWPSKLEFACDAIRSIEVTRFGARDRGDLRADIAEYVRATRVILRHPLARRIIPDLVAERLRSDELSVMLDSIALARRQFGHRLLNRAVARKELRQDINRELALDLLFGLLYARIVIRGAKYTDDELNQLVLVLESAIQAC